MFIRSFRVKNFMIHRDSRIEFPPLTVFVGQNAGGKSAMFDALLNFSMVSRGKIAEAFAPWPYSFAARRHQGAGRTSPIRFEVTMARSHEATQMLSYRIGYVQNEGRDAEPTYNILEEKLEDPTTGKVFFDRLDPDQCGMFGGGEFLAQDRSIFAGIRRAQIAGQYTEQDPLVTYCAKQISRFNKFRLDPSILARPGRLPEMSIDELNDPRIPRLDHHGEDLAAVLYYLSETDSPMIREILKCTEQVIEGFSGFEFNRVGVDRIGFSAKFSDARGIVPAAHLSDGMLTLIGLIVLVTTPDRPPLMCIEEPENGLTPKATRAFYKAVRSLAFCQDEAQRSQILISSHSPFVICEAWNGDDRDFIYQVKQQNGEAVIRPFKQVIEEEGIQLAKVEGKRAHLSLRTADEVMAGFWS